MLGVVRSRPTTAYRWRLVSQLITTKPLNLTSPLCRASPSQPVYSPAASIRSIHLTARVLRNAPALQESSGVEEDVAESAGPATKFAQLAERNLVDPTLIRTLTSNMGLETMTEVQSMTINEALKGKDVLAQAKTGTGKTIGFLLPVLQNILREDPSLISSRHRAPRFGERASDIRAIIISPTRELAEQIAAEAQKLTQGTGMVVQTAVGGTQKSAHLRAMQREGCHILVGTPGRLKDILSDRQTGVDAPKLSAFVLDEADRLLDQGFWPEIQAIQDLLPTRKEKDRQTLMFSATVPKEVVELVRSIMKPDLHYVRTVDENEEPTHERVKQFVVSVPGLENLLPTVLELCQREIDASSGHSTNRRPFKAIVYFNATAETTLASSIFFNIRRNNDATTSYMGDTRVFEIHSRLTQRQRTTAADYFRHAKSAILMSSDVTARGMDFPGVTHVIQVGLPNERDTYIHRLGRTARAGQEGEGWLILTEPTLREARIRLGKLPLQVDTTLQAPKVDFTGSEGETNPQGMTKSAQQIFDTIRAGALKVEPEELEKTFLGLLGTFNWFKNKTWLIAAMNRLSKVQWGMEKPPSIGRSLATKLGLGGIPGLQIGSRAFGPSGAKSSAPRKFGDSEGGDRRGGASRGRDFGDGARGGDRRSDGFGGGDRGGDRRSSGGFGGGERRSGGFGDRTGGPTPERRGGFGGGGRGGGGFGGSDRSPRNDRGSSSGGGFGGGGRGGSAGGGRGGYSGGRGRDSTR